MRKFFTTQLREENLATGYALWCVLDSHVDWDVIAFGNQIQDHDFEGNLYDATKPQSVYVSFGHQSHGVPYRHYLPMACEPFTVLFEIDPSTDALDYKGQLNIVTRHPDGDNAYRFEEITYDITVRKFLKLYRHLHDPAITADMLVMLDEVNQQEYYYTKEELAADYA